MFKQHYTSRMLQKKENNKIKKETQIFKQHYGSGMSRKKIKKIIK